MLYLRMRRSPCKFMFSLFLTSPPPPNVLLPLPPWGSGSGYDIDIYNIHITNTVYLNLEYQQRGDDQHLPLNCRHFLHHDAVPPARARSDNNQISCWEDGRFVFTYKERTGGKEALFNVKWTNPARGNVVALSHFRGLVEGLAL